MYPRDCAEARNLCTTNDPNGVYLIKPDGYPEPFEVYCDNLMDSGGWTIGASFPLMQLQGNDTRHRNIHDTLNCNITMISTGKVFGTRFRTVNCL